MRRKTGISIIVVFALLGGLLYFSTPIRVRYHRARMLHDYDKIREIGFQGNQEPYTKAFDRHRDALVRLGFFQHEKIPLRHVRIPSDDLKALFSELNDNTRIESAFFSISGYEKDTPAGVEIWATPDQMQKLQRIVSEHDKEPVASDDGGGVRQELRD